LSASLGVDRRRGDHLLGRWLVRFATQELGGLTRKRVGELIVASSAHQAGCSWGPASSIPLMLS
jgi:hypothetical protein